MHKDLKWKIPLILVLVLGAAWLAWPLKEKIALGLDLQGGMHLVLEVEVEKAVESSLERMADDIKRDVENDDMEVEKISSSFANRSLRIRLIDSVDGPPIEKILVNFPFLEKQEAADDGLVLNYHLSACPGRTDQEKRRHSGLGNHSQPRR